MSNVTLYDQAKLNGNDKIVGLIEENLTSAPEISIFPTRTIAGTSYTTVKRTGFPSVGFRSANSGSTPGKSTFVKSLIEAFLFGGVIQADKGVAMANEDGSEAWEMIEAAGVVRQAMINLGTQIWYGTSADASGFTGIQAATPKGTATVYDATGTTATTASSVYGVKFGLQDVIMPIGKAGTLDLSEFRDQQITFDGGTTWLPGRVADLCAWLGLQIGNVNCVGRICNLTEDVGKSLTDAKIETWLSQYPVGYMPDRVFMSRRSRRQLQISRTVVLNGGATGTVDGGQGNIATLPTTTAGGIPITVTDSIRDNDAIE
jgi:hypothetical protein